MALPRTQASRASASPSPQRTNPCRLHGHRQAEAFLQEPLRKKKKKETLLCALLQSLRENGDAEAAAEALSHIAYPLPPSAYLALLKASINSNCLPLALRIRSHISVNNVSVTGFLGDYFVMALAKCGAVHDACILSSTLPNLTVYSSTSLIAAYAELDRGEDALQAYQDMLKAGIDPDSFTFVSLFKACGSMPHIFQGKVLHVHAYNMGLATHRFVGNTIVSMYGKCRALSDAEDVFSKIQNRDTVSWNGMLSVYVDRDQAERSFLLYRQMHAEGVDVDLATFVIILQACATLAEDKDASRLSRHALYEIGKALHADAHKRRFDSHVLVGTAILSMYAQCGSFIEAESIFSVLAARDIIAWNAMLTAYVEQVQADKALRLFLQMQKEGIQADLLTYLSAVQACGILGEKTKNSGSLRTDTSPCLKIGLVFHMELCMKGYTDYYPVLNILLSMYGRCGALAESEGSFNGIIERDVVSWNAMLSAYCEHGQEEKALSLFEVMQTCQVTASDVTLICILQACGGRGDLELVRFINFIILSGGLDSFLAVMSTLISSYGNLAGIMDAEVIFNSFPEPNAVAWNACISGYSGNKGGVGSLAMLEDMKLSGLTPDEVTYTSLISSCSHNGLIAECLGYLISDRKVLTKEAKHLNIIVDLFGRAGDFKRLMSYFKNLEAQADWKCWHNLLGACISHSNPLLAKHAFDEAVQMEALESSVYVLMSNIYADIRLL